MPIFEQGNTKVLFIHIPKTGGSSIENMLKQQVTMTFFSPTPPSGLKICPQHLQINDFKILFGCEKWSWIFSVVRDPYDRIESEYHWKTDAHFKKSGNRLNFSQWVINQLNAAKKNPFALDNHLRPQTDFISSNVEIFKYEDGLHEITSELEKYFDFPETLKLPTDNTSNRDEVHWSNEALNFVNDFYKNDFMQLNYKERKPLVHFSKRSTRSTQDNVDTPEENNKSL